MESFQSAKDEIKRAADIVELVGQFVQLKKAGKNYLGLCPFHSERDPSFTVSPAKQMFHCFGCKKGGDIFAFWMAYHQVDFSQAFRDLADKYQVQLPEQKFSSGDRAIKEFRDLLFRINQVSAEYFHQILTRSERGKPAREYLENRGINGDIISEYMIGFSLDEWNGLTDHLKAKKFEMEKVVRAGLIIPRKRSGYYDRFRGRIVFPIINMREQIIGFGGRVMDDGSPKYLNSPETPIFRKGELLYGLHTAHRHIREMGYVLIAEGYTDVLALRRHGFKEAVGTLGTALTENHVRMLKGYANEAMMVFDADAAGKMAVLNSLTIFLNQGMPAKVIVLPKGEDPDSFLDKNGQEALSSLIKEAIPLLDFYLREKTDNFSNSIEATVSLLEEIIPVIHDLKSETQRSMVMRQLAEKLNVSESSIRKELHGWEKKRDNRTLKAGFEKALSASKGNILSSIDDDYMLNLLIHHPQTVDQLIKTDCRNLLSDPAVIEIFDSVVKMYNEGITATTENISESIREKKSKERLREAMLLPPFFSDENINQVLDGFGDKAYRIKMAHLKKEAMKSIDLHKLNKILALKKEKEKHLL
jgi:DNA primase